MVPAPRLVLLALASLVCALILPASASPVVASIPAMRPGCSQAWDTMMGGTGLVTCTFAYTGSTQTFTVPGGAYRVGVSAWGGHGGTTGQGSGVTAGGRGAAVSGQFWVTEGEVLTITVGGDAVSQAGAYGYGYGGRSSDVAGGGGGGATAVAIGALPLLVAGAGGGAGAPVLGCPSPGAGGDAGADGESSAPCGVTPAAAGGSAGGSSTQDGGDSVPAPGSQAGGGGGGGGYLGGGGGQDGPVVTPSTCCVSSAGGGGGTNYADPSSGANVSVGLSNRSAGDNGFVQISYQPQGRTASLGLTPDPVSVPVGTEQYFAVTGYNDDGAAVSDFNGHVDLSITPDGSCSVETCTPASPGPHTVKAVYDGYLTATATLNATAAPAFTSDDSLTLVPGVSHDFTVTTTGTPAPTLAMTGGSLPSGMTFTDNGDGTATISGTPTARLVTRQVTLTATNDTGSTSQALTIVVEAASGACVNPRLGSAGNDYIEGSPRGDQMAGRAGDDTLLGYAGSDCLSGDAGDDELFGGRDDDQVLGGAGNDHLVGGPGEDLLDGGAGADVIRADDGEQDVVDCGPDRDSVVADRTDVLRRCERITIR